VLMLAKDQKKFVSNELLFYFFNFSDYEKYTNIFYSGCSTKS
jgi:hypothetical protein